MSECTQEKIPSNSLCQLVLIPCAISYVNFKASFLLYSFQDKFPSMLIPRQNSLYASSSNSANRAILSGRLTCRLPRKFPAVMSLRDSCQEGTWQCFSGSSRTVFTRRWNSSSTQSMMRMMRWGGRPKVRTVAMSDGLMVCAGHGSVGNSSRRNETMNGLSKIKTWPGTPFGNLAVFRGVEESSGLGLTLIQRQTFRCLRKHP